MKEMKYSSYSRDDGSGNASDEMLDQVLKTDPMLPLPAGFADRIAIKAVRRIILKRSLNEFFVYAAVVILAGLIFGGIFYFTNPEVWSRWANFLLSRVNILAGTALVGGFIFFVDHVLFPWLFFSSSANCVPARQSHSGGD